YPYLIQSQHRTGNAHHYADGSRTTLLVTRNGLRLHTAPLAPLEALSASGDAVPSSLPASLPAPSLLPHG
ncbi:MAG: hypothetical protein CUN48_16000, partial [Candidatus Thermofonsia Clade 3 bacterium]